MPKKSTNTTLNNVFDLLNRFYSNEKLSIDEIAKLYNISKRTVYRYINDYLKPAGFNIIKQNNKFLLKKNFEYDNFVIETIKNFSKEIGVYKKLEKIFKDIETNNIVYSKFNIESIIDIKIYDLITKAIEEKIEIKFYYKKYNKYYKLKPLKIVNFEGYWYLVGLDKSYIRFHLNEIDDISFLERFELDENIDLKNAINIWYSPNRESFRVEFFAYKNIVPHINRIKLNPTQIEISRDKEGNATFEIYITHKEEIKRFIKSYLPDIRILSPKWLDDEIKEEIRKYVV